MLVDDSIELAIADLKEGIQGQVGEEGAKVAIETVVHAMAHLSVVGIPILTAWKDFKQKRINERIVELLTDMNNQSKTNNINKDYFKSEEFQTLFALTLEQLITTHDREKLHLLASALANSVSVAFSAENRKELFMRILRNLAPEHVAMLRRLTKYSISQPESQDLAILQALVADGLVRESFRPDASFSEPRFGRDWSEAEVKRAIKEYVKAVLVRTYIITEFGKDFMKFLGESHLNP